MKIEDLDKAAKLKTSLEAVRVPRKFVIKNTSSNVRHGNFYNKELVGSVTVRLYSRGEVGFDEEDGGGRSNELGTFSIPEPMVIELMEAWEAEIIGKLKALGIEVS